MISTHESGPMSDRIFQFDLYRINKVPGERTLFVQQPKNIETDDDIEFILHQATSPRRFYTEQTAILTARWDLRGLSTLSESKPRVLSVSLARSLMSTEGLVVTDFGFETKTSEIVPPMAAGAILVFYMDRHLVLVEHLTMTSKSLRWRIALEDILRETCESLGYDGHLEFESVLPAGEILEAFRSFDQLTRLKLTLRLPNPDLSRFAKQLFQMMQDGRVREYNQDMRNPNGLNQEDGALPHASIEMAAAGYKKDDIQLEGLQNGRPVKKRLGRKAVRGQLDGLRSVLRTQSKTATTKETQRFIAALEDEIERIAPSDVRTDQESSKSFPHANEES